MLQKGLTFGMLVAALLADPGLASETPTIPSSLTEYPMKPADELCLEEPDLPAPPVESFDATCDPDPCALEACNPEACTTCDNTDRCAEGACHPLDPDICSGGSGAGLDPVGTP